MNKQKSTSRTTAKRTRRKFSDEYKAEAVKMVTEQGYKVAEAARQLGVSSNTLQRWKGQFSYKEKDSDSEEVQRLRSENKRLRMERDILKKRRPAAGGLTAPVEPLQAKRTEVSVHPGSQK